MPATILLVGRITRTNAVRVASLEKQYTLRHAKNGKQAIEIIADESVDLVLLDAESMKTPGVRICNTLRDTLEQTPIVHIHPAPKRDVKSKADALLFPPLSTKHLLNSIERFINQSDEETIQCGPFQMNAQRRLLIAHGEETQLTPKQSALLEIFLRNPGKTLERRHLMQQVWKTTYLDDTRTLDVHIRWIRKILEQNAKKPRYLKTVRGVGYRLVLPEKE